MQKQAPTFGRLLTMVLFALSCFGLLLFLWLAFGGPIPLKPKGYRFKVAVPEANQLAIEADVRSAGVHVGKVRAKRKAPTGNTHARHRRARAQVRAARRRRARRSSARRRCSARSTSRSRAGTPGAPKLPEGGRLPDARGRRTPSSSTRCSASSTSRRASCFRTWQQDLGKAVERPRRSTSTTRSATCRGSPPSGTDVLEVLDQQEGAVARLVKNTGVVFGALTEREDQLRNLIVNTDQVFDATAQPAGGAGRDVPDLPDVPRRVARDDGRPRVVLAPDAPARARPAPGARRTCAPTLRDVRALAPDLSDFFRDLDPLITASQHGLPALREVLDGAKPLLGQLQPFLEELNPILEWLEYHQHTTADFFANGGGALVDTERGAAHAGGARPLPRPVRPHRPGVGRRCGPSAARRTRGNAYLDPTMQTERREEPARMILPSWDCNNTPEGEHTTEKGDTSDEPSCWIKPLPGPTRFPHIKKADYDEVAAGGRRRSADARGALDGDGVGAGRRGGGGRAAARRARAPARRSSPSNVEAAAARRRARTPRSTRARRR